MKIRLRNCIGTLIGGLAGIGLAACQPREPCQLDFARLMAHRNSAVVSLDHQGDTLKLVWGGQLTWMPFGANSLAALDSTTWRSRPGSMLLYDKLMPVRFTTCGPELELVTAAPNSLPFAISLNSRVLDSLPRTLLKARITSPKVQLSYGLRVGMSKQDFLAIFFKNLSSDDVSCLNDYHVFINQDPVGEYIIQTFTFAGDELKEIRMQLPEMARSEQKSAR
ncbi:MAG: hypothetical protein M3Y54_14905 [Bacteroidota bacterium]|nr:hypothetical protein [Bacteroidota bacterium]